MMKSWLGALAALGVALAFATTYAYAMRPGAGWMDASPLLLVALPFNEALLAAFGETNFSPDSPLQVLAAALAEALPFYILGALIEAGFRALRGRA